MHCADSDGCHIVHGTLHILHEFYDGQRMGNVVGDGEKSLPGSSHRYRDGNRAALQASSEVFQQQGIDNAGMPVIFHDHRRLIRTDFIQFIPADQVSFPYRTGDAPNAMSVLFLQVLKKRPNHIGDFLVGFGVHDIKTCMEGGKLAKC